MIVYAAELHLEKFIFSAFEAFLGLRMQIASYNSIDVYFISNSICIIFTYGDLVEV